MVHGSRRVTALKSRRGDRQAPVTHPRTCKQVQSPTPWPGVKPPSSICLIGRRGAGLERASIGDGASRQRLTTAKYLDGGMTPSRVAGDGVPASRWWSKMGRQRRGWPALHRKHPFQTAETESRRRSPNSEKPCATRRCLPLERRRSADRTGFFSVARVPRRPPRFAKRCLGVARHDTARTVGRVSDFQGFAVFGLAQIREAARHKCRGTVTRNAPAQRKTRGQTAAGSLLRCVEAV